VPAKALRDPFVDQNYIKNEINLGVNFLLLRLGGEAVAVMGYQSFSDAFLVRHAYVKPNFQRKGCGQYLLDFVIRFSDRKPIMLGCFKRADWAVKFYEKNGFSKVNDSDAIKLRKRYWRYGQEHINCSMVMKRDDR
jgi:GNAT superfamily N-acetyltransferase